MTHEEQAALVQRFQGGDKAAFAELYDFFLRPIYNFIYYKTHHKETAEDLTSLTFTKALDKILSFDSTKGPFSAWLYQIARNIVIDHYRTNRSHSDIEDVWDLNDGSDVIRDIDARNQLEKVKKYLQELTSEQRDIVIMRVWQDMSYAEIAASLGKSEASCKMAYSRAIHRLREKMPMEVLIFFLTMAHIFNS